MQFDWLTFIIGIIILVIFSLGSIYFLTWIKMKKQELLAKTKNETAKKYIELLDTTITECVLATNQTFVETLKKEGSFDKEAQKKAFKQTYDAVTTILPDDVTKYLNETVSDVNAYLTNKIEASVSLSKR